MKRSLFTIIAIPCCVAAAWMGWKMGTPAPAEAPQPVSKRVTIGKAPVKPADYSAASAPEFDARKNRPLSDILTSIDLLRLDPVAQTSPDDGISGELFAILYSLKAEEIPGVLQHLAALPPPVPDKLLTAVLGRWAQFDGTAAMQWAQQLSPARQDAVRGDILAGWARSNPQAAWNYYLAAWNAAPEPRYRLEQNFPVLIHAWALQDAPAALAACLAEGKHGTFNPWRGFGSLAALPEHRDDVMRLIAGIADEKVRTKASQGALLAWAASAPIDAAAWLDANMPQADSNLLWSVAERYGRAHPKENADWLLKRAQPGKLDEIYGMCLYQWAEVAPDEAAAWLENAGITDSSAEAIATRYARSDLDRAITWAQRTTPAKRKEAIANTLAQARSAGKEPDLSKYAPAAGVSVEELSNMVDKAAQMFRSRL